MKARTPKEYRDLTPKQKEKIKEYIIEVAAQASQRQVERDRRAILDGYMKMVCCILHDAYGFGEKRLTNFMGCHKRIFKKHFRLVEKGEQMEYLNKRMSEIFRKNGFPQDFLDNFLGEVEPIVDIAEEV